MVLVPTSARRLVGVAVAVFAVPLLLTFRPSGVIWSHVVQGVELLSAAGCAAPLCFRDRKRFRVACAAGGAVVASLWTPALLLGLLAALALGDWGWLLTHLALAGAAIAALIAAFQRAKGADHGRPAAAIGWAAGALSLGAWACVALGA
ncbi:hypothetical protein [Streptomyces sp. Y1]|uniref:Integral membrane protein n=1 Tax=Streptomyces sp. Y1 TaxID=3238634 RepID=A0AB39TQX6_9ACTN